jgi:thiamine pyrophosphate-dependent acetolactate synthase large subunit-like protein
MALYNAFCDKVPVYLMIGNIVAADKRGAPVEWAHSAQDPAAMARDFLKWDDQPQSLQHFAESAVRAYKLATTAPMAPVLLSLDGELQENPIKNRSELQIPKIPRQMPAQADQAALNEIARLLVEAQNPVIIADRMARTPACMGRFVELAELLQCAVIDKGGRTNFPSRHPLNHTARASVVVPQADVILGIELNDFWGSLNTFSDRIERASAPLAKESAKTISLGVHDMFVKANYQEFERYPNIDLDVAGDGESSLPGLIEAVKKYLDEGRRAAFEARGKKLADAHDAAILTLKRRATIGWDSSPITMARLVAEIWDQIRTEDWALVGENIQSYWPRFLWDADRSYRFNGNSGGFGLGYSAPAALGAALANKKHGRLSIAIQGDGDLMYAPGTLWTAAHHNIPILYVMHNNRAYHQEYMYVQDMCCRLGRGIENAHIGTTMTSPNIDFAKVAQGFGVYAEGPISDPAAFVPALKRAIAVVKEGRPALLDTLVEPR